jgi:hypothetical protein
VFQINNYVNEPVGWVLVVLIIVLALLAVPGVIRRNQLKANEHLQNLERRKAYLEGQLAIVDRVSPRQADADD